MSVPHAMRPLARVWSHYNYAWFMGGMTPNLVTLWMQRVGTIWLAWELTGSNAWVGAIVAADYAPMMVLAPFVGAFVDRVNPVTVQKLTQWLTLAMAALLAVLVFAGLMTIALLLVLSLIMGCLHPFNAIARHAIVPNTVPKPDIPTALACDSALFNAARFIGPACAGMLIPIYGVGITFAINALGCVSYLIGLYAMRLAVPARPPRAAGGLIAEIGEGLVYVRRHAGIGPVFLLLAVGAVWIRPLQDLLPGFSDDVFAAGASGLGWLTAAMGIGAMIAAAAIAVYGRTSGLTLVVMGGFLLNVVTTFAFVATSNIWVGLLAAVIWGGSLTITTTAAQALVQSCVDGGLRARVMALYSMIYRGAPFLGALVIGAVADLIGLRLAFALAAALCIVPWLLTMRRLSSLTVALEGHRHAVDQRMMAAARNLAGRSVQNLATLWGKQRSGAVSHRDASQPDVPAARRGRGFRQPSDES